MGKVLVLAALVAFIFATSATPPALAHDEAATTVQGHVEEDSVFHSPAIERRLEQRTDAITAADAEAGGSGGNRQRGSGGTVGPCCRLAGGRRSMWHCSRTARCSPTTRSATTRRDLPVHDHTRATVWDPDHRHPDAGQREPRASTSSAAAWPTSWTGPCSSPAGTRTPRLEGIVADAHLRFEDQHLEPGAEHGGWSLVPERDAA